MAKLKLNLPPLPKPPAPSPAIRIRSLIHDLDLGTYALELRLRMIDGKMGTLTVPRSATAAPHDIFRQLLDAGALQISSRVVSIDL